MFKLLPNNARAEGLYHILAIATVVIWGTTFISTKVLLEAGLHPSSIFFYRFFLAYLLLLAFFPRPLFAANFRDELLLMAGGFFGGAFYFAAENTALQISQASNVALIITTTPIFTAILSYLFLKDERPRFALYLGSTIGLLGVAFVVYNGTFELKIDPLGDILALLSALSWASYNIVLKRINKKYSTGFITRKVFFYGLVLILPMFFFYPLNHPLNMLLEPKVLYNLLFLGVMASMLCFLSWTVVIERLGALRSSNYVYIVPLVTMLTSYFFLEEVITPTAIVGGVLVLAGVRISQIKSGISLKNRGRAEKNIE